MATTQTFPRPTINKSGEEGFMVALYPDAHVAERISLENGEPTASLHVTLAYVGAGSPETAVQVARDVASRYDTLYGKLSGVGQFVPGKDGNAPFIAHVSVSKLDMLRSELVQHMKVAGVGPSEDYPFVPHLTLKYLRPGETPPEHPLAQRAVPVRFDALHVVSGDNHIAKIPLRGINNPRV